MIKKTHFLFIIFLIIVVITYFITGDNLQKKAKYNFDLFNASNINDKLLTTDYYAKGVKLIFSDKEYIFYPITSSLNNNTIFNTIAEKGDSILKKPKQKEVILKKKNGKIYKYTFKSF
jgi:hypothetical protein